MKQYILGLVLALLGISFFSLDSTSFAQEIPKISNGGGLLPGADQTKPDTDEYKKADEYKKYVIETFLPKLSSGFIIALFAYSSIFIIIAGVIYIVSSGDSEMTKKAKDIIFWTIAGVGIASLSLAIVKFIIGIDFS
ncbi:MAG: hypothetical protein OEL89_03825 [Candidatus Peregrinibacteria bacterium]|nr:hypothetical protein [Candidatus Peregrinibacteria bacterium]